MRVRVALGLAVVAAGAGALASAAVAEQDTPGIVTLQEAMTGATAMTELQGHYLFIARPDGGFVCGINLNDRFFKGVITSPETAFANRPGAVCVTARVFEDLTQKDRTKL